MIKTHGDHELIDKLWHGHDWHRHVLVLGAQSQRKFFRLLTALDIILEPIKVEVQLLLFILVLDALLPVKLTTFFARRLRSKFC